MAGNPKGDYRLEIFLKIHSSSTVKNFIIIFLKQ